uniref:Uncharacterized protein n=1 Tax=Candidatus Kentrum sp. FW TaxID=2126338 RepID=A0A450TUP8_9GAMM|nr:MAG: hypothetical protein BECKFW1821C_GA0114237_103630 [Candidatus Kentron sp. FW]
MSTQQNTRPTDPFFIWGILTLFAAMVGSGVAIRSADPFLSRSLLALSVLISGYGFLRAARENNKFAGIISALATIIVIAFLVRQQWDPDPVVIVIAATSGIVLALVLWRSFSVSRHQLQHNLIDAPSPLKKRFVGRLAEIQQLDKTWANVISGQSPYPTVGVIAWGGFGKTSLVRQWLWWYFERGSRSAKGKPDTLFWQSFQEGQSADAFAPAIIRHFSQDPQSQDIPQDNAQRIQTLHDAIGDRRYLLVLDGLEMEQDRTQEQGFGKFQSPFSRDLLQSHASGWLGQGLVLVTSRVPLADLEEDDTYHAIDLEDSPLEDQEIRDLLKSGGVKECSDEELTELIDVSGRHPLTLATIASILDQYNQGRAAGWRRFEDEQFIPEGDQRDRHLWRVLAWTDRSLDAPETRVMTTIAHFREPVRPEWLDYLLAPEAVPPLEYEAEPMVPVFDAEELKLPGEEMSESELRKTLAALVDLGFLRREEDSYTMHGLVREHFRRQLARENQDGPMEIHTRLYRLYTAIIQPVWRPDGLEGLRPLYEAVYHSARAGLHQETLDNVYFNRILRGTGSDGFYSISKLGAIEADLAAVANFFGQSWRVVSPKLSAPDRAWLLNEAATRLRALGRLREAREPMGAGLDMRIEQEDWNNAARGAGNLSQLALTLGAIERAVKDGERSVTFADRSGDKFQRMSKRTTHADALHQAGDRAAARALFQTAEEMQAENQPLYPRLYSLQGFLYADLLLGGAERAAWRVWLDPCDGDGTQVTQGRTPSINAGTDAQAKVQALIADCERVNERATRTLEWAENAGIDILSAALDHLTLARAGVYRALLSGGGSCAIPPKAGDTQPPDTAPQTAVETHISAAVQGLREAGTMDHLPRSLLTRAWVRAITHDLPGARSDLAEAWKIADNGSMGLFQADILLTRARLLFREDKDRAREELHRARDLVEEYGYHRRDGELADAEEVVHGRYRK